MEWLANTDDMSQSAASISRAFEILRQNPPKPSTKRLSKIALRKAKGLSQYDEIDSDDDVGGQQSAITDLDLAAFPPLSRLESTASQRLRAEAYKSASASIKEKYNEFCKNLDGDDFERLWGDFVRHQSPAKLELARMQRSTERRRPDSEGGVDPLVVPPALPTAVLSSRGIGSEADDCDMVTRLIEFLRENKAYVTSLKAKDLLGGVGAVINAVLLQLLPPDAEDWGVHDIEGLYAWYLEEAGASPIAAEVIPAQVDAQPAVQGASPSEETEVAAPSPSLPKPQRSSRQLRTRKTPAAGKDKSKNTAASPSATVGDLFGGAQRANRERPLVLLIEGTEQADTDCLRDLIKILNQDHAKFPVCLILCASTPIDVVCASFSTDMLSGLQLASFHRVSQEERLDRFFQDVLLSIKPDVMPLVLSLAPMEMILDRFNKTDGSVHSIWKALDLAAMEHCRGHPLSALAAAALSCNTQALETTVEALPHDVIKAASAKIAASAPVDTHVDISSKKGGAAAGRGRGGGGGSLAGGAKAGVEPGEVKGPASAEARRLVEAASAAGAGWAAWRLGMLWTSLVADKTGAKCRSDLHLHALYVNSAREGFFPPSSQAAAAMTYKGTRLVHLLTGPVASARGSASVRSLSNESCEVTNLIDELLVLADNAIKACQGSTLITEATETLRRLVAEDEARNLEVLVASPSNLIQGLSVISSEDPNPVGPPREGSVITPQGAGDPSGEVPANASTKPKGSGRRGAGGGIRGHFPAIPTPGAVNKELSPLTRALGKVALKTPSTVTVDVRTKVAAEAEAAAAAPVINKTQKTNAVLRKERTAALLQAAKAAGGKAADRTEVFEPAGHSNDVPKPPSLQDDVADFLAQYLPLLLGSCPFKLPGASAFTYGRTWELQSQLLYAPRAAVHEALLRPHTFLGGAEQDIGQGLESTALAYRLLLGQDTIDVGRWLGEFCAACENGEGEGLSLRMDGAGMEGDGADAMDTGRGRGRGKAKGRRLGRRHSPEGDRNSEGARPRVRGRSVGKTSVEEDDCALPRLPALTEQQQEERALNLAARFSQAVAELQFIGICRPNKRQKAASTMQRTFYPPEAILG